MRNLVGRRPAALNQRFGKRGKRKHSESKGQITRAVNAVLMNLKLMQKEVGRMS